MKWILVAIFALASGCVDKEAGRAEVDQAAMTSDPATVELQQSATPYVTRATLSNRVQTGLITLGDGEAVKYWFKGYHSSSKISYTRFEFADGLVAYLRGCFCCEVVLPDEQLASRKELLAFIAIHDGEPP